ncbi:hypothetical protein [Salinivibrio sp. MA351]|uniref:hypothetical protein n=1 Tax=Salinivibrio sp. MA351 TaxID=1909453 RepID=UPI0018FE326B|nr:hypothetical protein [Salinivibrio sp. MA351]
MRKEDIKKKILDLAIAQWNQSFGGTSALDICDKISVSNEEVMREMESLCKDKKGTINANVELCAIRIDPENPKFEIPKESTTTHVFFPSKELLEDHFYDSKLVREGFPEYKNRLHCGAHQLELVMFSEEVLSRYFDHPEWYEIDDSLSGGHIWAKSEAPENRYLYVRHGKRKLDNGQSAVTAIFKDLYAMSPEEQRHWHAYELNEASFDSNDPNFARFVVRTYDGACVDSPKPIQEVLNRITEINQLFGEELLFKKYQNDHFRPPVENTRKSYYDSCSELYKLIGPDSLNQKLIKNILKKEFSTADGELIHKESKRPLSTIQLLELLEEKMGVDGVISSKIRLIGKDRMEADHKITSSAVEEHNFTEEFIFLCQKFSCAANQFKHKLQQHALT